MEAAKYILQIEELSKSYDKKNFALKDFSYELEKGKICAVVGESGSGKSTLLKLIAGLERSDHGQINMGEQILCNDQIHLSPQKRSVGLVFQDFALFPHLKVKENIAFGLQTGSDSKIQQMLKAVRLEGYEDRFPSELSGGQEQRVAIARSLVREPELLLLDEPFSNLDTNLKSELRHEIKRLIKDLGLSMIFITHDIYDAIDIADEIIFLKEGEIIRKAAIADIFKAVKNNYVKDNMEELKRAAETILSMIPK
jgi:iron(III) transport system ATP-binding protein